MSANFTDTPYTNPQNGQTYPVIRMTKKGFHFVVGKFTGAKAVQHQIAFADEFERMEAELSSQAHDPTRLTLAQSLAAEVAAVASRTVFQAVVSGQERLECTRWAFGMDLDVFGRGDKLVPYCHSIDRDAHIASMTSLAEMILMPNGICPTDTELATLLLACATRLNKRIDHRAAR